MGFHRNNILITHLILQCKFYVFVLHTTTTKTVYALTAYQVLVLFCRQDFGNSGQKSFRDFGNDLEKFPRFWKPLNTVLKNIGNF